ncbi:sensor histidine kinase [Hyphobacterium sp.]|uniref:sensor histidine kinase n=1 Tax=Hyphobacterium sp. TaxID=2004662 RepID=UPI003B5268C9
MRLIESILDQGGRITHLAWIGALAAVSPLIIAASPVASQLTLAALGAAALPGIAGLLLAHRRTAMLGTLILTLIWVSLSASAAVASGGLAGPGAMIFLLPVAAMASFANRRGIIESAALSGMTALLIGGLQFSGLLPISTVALDVFAPAFVACLAVFALGFSIPAMRLLRRRAVLSALAHRHNRRSRAFRKAPVALLADRDGQIVAASEATHALMPGLPKEIDGLPLADLAFDSSAKWGFERPGTQPVSLRVRGASGDPENVSVFRSSSGVTVIVPGGHETAAEAEEALRRERDLAVSENQAKSEFLASVSHEIRTPLNAIIGFSDAMKSRLFGPIPAKYAEYADLIHESGRHLLELIGDVLDLSRIEADSYSLQCERFNASDVIDLCIRMLSQRAGESGIEIETDMPADLPVDADRRAFRQILLNLLSNAVKFTPDGGVIVVLAKAQDGSLTLAVGDSGPGIAQDELARLGERFQQASTAQSSSERGSGLGLSLVKALAQMHGGEMAIDSKLGEGTTVSVVLPVIAASEETPDEDQTLEVHSRIQLAQSASETLISSAG